MILAIAKQSSQQFMPNIISTQTQCIILRCGGNDNKCENMMYMYDT